MKKLILRLLFNNYERGLINCALHGYSSKLFNTRSETASEDGCIAVILASSFEFEREDPVWPLIPQTEDKFLKVYDHERLVEDYDSVVDNVLRLEWERTVV